LDIAAAAAGRFWIDKRIELENEFVVRFAM
jgi:hypothetical protein